MLLDARTLLTRFVLCGFLAAVAALSLPATHWASYQLTSRKTFG